jgi:phage gpG-like protein
MIETNIQELENYLNDMSKRTTNMKPIMNSIGETLHRKSMEAFEKEKDPITGRAWSPISSTSLFAQTGGKKNSKTKSGKHTKSFLRAVADKRILRDKGDLQNSIDYTATNDSLEFVAAKEYAATHFFGDRKRNIKQRRYMPFTDDLDIDRKTTDEILEDLADYIVGD